VSDRRPVTTVFGMTLHNNARYLREAIASILAQTDQDFALVMLDDGSTDDTPSIAGEYEQGGNRVQYFRHDTRQGMVATWKDVAAIARREHPEARYFAWASDHDRWHPTWLERMRAAFDAHPDIVLAYPVTSRIGEAGEPLDKGPRYFETVGLTDVDKRWRHFCHEGVGSGDMVYGLFCFQALERAGVFRPALRPDRLLIAELALQGQFKQVDEVLWFRRQSGPSSIARQGQTLFLEGQEPKWFRLPAWMQHALIIRREYGDSPAPPVRIDAGRLRRMLLRYQLTYGWRHVRKTETSHAIGRGIDNAIWVKKIIKRTYHHAVYYTLVTGHALWGRSRRLGRRALYEILMFTHRTGLRGSSNGTRGR
jgi:glycosyltransferase involved in cell wall biosynthesis